MIKKQRPLLLCKLNIEIINYYIKVVFKLFLRGPRLRWKNVLTFHIFKAGPPFFLLGPPKILGSPLRALAKALCYLTALSNASYFLRKLSLKVVAV